MARALNQDRAAHLWVPDGGGMRDGDRLTNGAERIEQLLQLGPVAAFAIVRMVVISASTSPRPG